MKEQGPPPPNTPYHRPNRPYICGRLCQGKPCNFGPLPNGQCSDIENPCQPKWSLRRKRKWISIATCVVSLLIVALCLKLSSTNPMLFNPGPLSHQHAKLIRPSQPGQAAKCSSCHAINDQRYWLNKDIFNHDHYVDSHACIDCHQQTPKEGAVQQANWLKPHGLSDIQLYPEASQSSFQKDLHCIQCHREHRGLYGTITLMSEDKCHSCHQQSFESFNHGHPEFKTYPYRSPKAVYFNHGREEHATMDCATCHTYNRLEERHDLTNFEESCAQCHQKDIIDVDKYRFEVFKLSLKAPSYSNNSEIMSYLFPQTHQPKAHQLLDYLHKKFNIALFLEGILPNHKELDIDFLKTLFKGCDPQRVKHSLGFIPHELNSYWAAMQQSTYSVDMFFLLNFWSLSLAEHRHANIHEDLLSLLDSITSEKKKEVYYFYLMQLYKSDPLNRALKAQQPKPILLELMKKSKSDVVHNLVNSLYSKPAINLSEAETDLHDELLEIIEGEMEDSSWAKWNTHKFYTYMLIEEELLELDSIWLALENDELEEKLEDLELEDILKSLLALEPNRLNVVYKKLKSAFTKEEPAPTLTDQQLDLLEEWQDIIDGEYDDDTWTKLSLHQFLYDLLIEEEHLDLDTLLTYLEDEALEYKLEDLEDEELISMILQHQLKNLNQVFQQLKKNNSPSKDGQMPDFQKDYKTSFQAHLHELKISTSSPYLFDEPSTQWIYQNQDQKVYYASGLHKDPVQLKLLQGHPNKNSLQLRSQLLKNLGDCTHCHTDPSIPQPQVDKVWKSHHRKTLYKFKHYPHTQNMSMQCNHCHQQDGQGAITKHGFYPIKKDQCTNCHQKNLAGEDCLQCHNYHADRLSQDRKNVLDMIKFLSLE